MKKFTDAKKKKYLKKAVGCPKCGAIDISGEGFEVDGNTFSQVVVCHKCDCVWTDIYTLSDVVILDD